MTKRDVVIIGGSLAGAACARELQSVGIDAIAFERARFPRRKVCGGFLSPGATDCIKHLGLLEEIRRAGAVDVTSARVRIGNAQFDVPFKQSGLGISRFVLDEILARAAHVEQGHAVREVRRVSGGFVVDGIHCAVAVDASGKLGRFTKRQVVPEFGVQYVEPQSQGSVLDFSFFEDGYGGSVSVEGGRSNCCFLIKRDALREYTARADCLVTGPLAYDRLPGDFIAIGDAAGMLDPACGDGMRHALETGILAARIIAAGIRRHARYDEMKSEYESEWQRRWLMKRAFAAGLRKLVTRPTLFSAAVQIAPARLINRLWS
jgi:flavin-dependent dehydrogenase